MKLKMNRMLVYRDLYDDALTLDECLSGISRETILSIAAYFLGYATQQSRFTNYKVLFQRIFNKENINFSLAATRKIQAISVGIDGDIVIINPNACLMLFEQSFEWKIFSDRKTTSEIERDIFKAILLLNQEITTKENIAISTAAKDSPKMNAASALLAQMFPYSSLVNYDGVEVLSTQIIKAIYFFEFIENNNSISFLLEPFNKYFDVSDWKQFINQVFPISATLVTSPKENHTTLDIPRDDYYESNVNFLEKFALKENHYEHQEDFINLRSHPLYKIEDGKYRIILRLFAAELLHKGVYFKIAELNSISENENKLSNFRAFYGEEFSEKYLFYKVLSHIFSNRYIEFSGEEMKRKGLIAEPDYYIRKGNKVFLFESKDILINSQIRMSYDYNIYSEDLKKKLYFYKKGDKIVKKAICQLVDNLEKIITKNFVVDVNYKPSSLRIYPILVLHDRQYNLPGLNIIINEWFGEALEKKGINHKGIKPIVLIDIDTLIFYQDTIRDRKLILEDLLDEYIKIQNFSPKVKLGNHERQYNSYRRMFLPFSAYISTASTKKGFIMPPKILYSKGLSIAYPN